MLRFDKISFEKFILLEDIGLMTFCYILKDFMSLGDFFFNEISLILLVSIFKTIQDL